MLLYVVVSLRTRSLDFVFVSCALRVTFIAFYFKRQLGFNLTGPGNAKRLDVDMGDYNHCVVCQRSLLRQRRHVLNVRFLHDHASFVEHIVRNIEPPQEVRNQELIDS